MIDGVDGRNAAGLEGEGTLLVVYITPAPILRVDTEASTSSSCARVFCLLAHGEWLGGTPGRCRLVIVRTTRTRVRSRPRPCTSTLPVDRSRTCWPGDPPLSAQQRSRKAGNEAAGDVSTSYESSPSTEIFGCEPTSQTRLDELRRGNGTGSQGFIASLMDIELGLVEVDTVRYLPRRS